MILALGITTIAPEAVVVVVVVVVAVVAVVVAVDAASPLPLPLGDYRLQMHHSPLAPP